MATAKKLPSGNWRVNLYIGKTPDGKRQYKSFTAETKKEAEFLAAQYNVDRRERKNSELTVKAAIARYIESKENVLSPMTVRGYKVVMNSYLDTLMPLKVSDVTQEAVQNEMNRMALKYSPKTCRNAHGLLTAVLQVYRPDFVLHTTLPQKAKREIYVPDADEVSRILKLVKGTANELPVFLAAECGMRAEEIAALRKSNIHPDHIDIVEAIVINDKLEQVVKKPKSTAGYRSVPITEEAYDFIMNLADEGERVCNRSNEIISNNWSSFRKRHESEISEHLNFHAFRHHYASKLLLLNIPQKYIAELMGHGSTDMIEKVYQHIFPSAMDEYKRAIRESMQHEMQHK